MNHLPGAKVLEIQPIRWTAKGQKDIVWDFSGILSRSSATSIRKVVP